MTKNIYHKIQEQELGVKSKHINQLNNDYSKNTITKNIEDNLIDVMVFCELSLERIRNAKKIHV
jgi:hypothetical protein